MPVRLFCRRKKKGAKKYLPPCVSLGVFFVVVVVKADNFLILLLSGPGVEWAEKNLNKSYNTVCSPTPVSQLRSRHANATPGRHRTWQLLCTTLLQQREEKGPRTYPGDSFFLVSIQQSKNSPGTVLLMATKPRLDRKDLVSTGFQKLHFQSYHPPPNPAAAFVAAFVRILLQMKTDE